MLNLQFQFARQAFLGDHKRHYFQTEKKIEHYPERTAYSWQCHNQFRMEWWQGMTPEIPWWWSVTKGSGCSSKGVYPRFQVTGIVKGFFWVWNFLFRAGNLASIFLGGLILVGIFFFYIQNNLKISRSACISRLHSSSNKVQPNLLLKTLFFMLNNLMLSRNF